MVIEAQASDVAVRTELSPRMMGLFVWMHHYYDARFEELGLTVANARALVKLEPDRPVPTRQLAAWLGCDPSNVTAFVDKLEGSGFIQRRVDPDDRRVKTLVITPEGRTMRERLITLMATDMPVFEALTAGERRSMLRLVNKAWAACEDHDAARDS